MQFNIKQVVNVSVSVLFATLAFQAIAADVSLGTGGYARELNKMEMMKMLDADGNHMVSKEEANSYYTSLFDTLDTNHDGKLDANEWTGKEGHQKIDVATGGFSRQLRNMKMMDVMDADHDHDVTKQEFVAFNEKVFEAKDTSGDGQLDPQEWLAAFTGNKK